MPTYQQGGMTFKTDYDTTPGGYGYAQGDPYQNWYESFNWAGGKRSNTGAGGNIAKQFKERYGRAPTEYELQTITNAHNARGAYQQYTNAMNQGQTVPDSVTNTLSEYGNLLPYNSQYGYGDWESYQAPTQTKGLSSGMPTQTAATNSKTAKGMTSGSVTQPTGSNYGFYQPMTMGDYSSNWQAMNDMATQGAQLSEDEKNDLRNIVGQMLDSSSVERLLNSSSAQIKQNYLNLMNQMTGNMGLMGQQALTPTKTSSANQRVAAPSTVSTPAQTKPSGYVTRPSGYASAGSNRPPAGGANISFLTTGVGASLPGMYNMHNSNMLSNNYLNQLPYWSNIYDQASNSSNNYSSPSSGNWWDIATGGY